MEIKNIIKIDIQEAVGDIKTLHHRTNKFQFYQLILYRLKHIEGLENITKSDLCKWEYKYDGQYIRKEKDNYYNKKGKKMEGDKEVGLQNLLKKREDGEYEVCLRFSQKPKFTRYNYSSSQQSKINKYLRDNDIHNLTTYKHIEYNKNYNIHNLFDVSCSLYDLISNNHNTTIQYPEIADGICLIFEDLKTLVYIKYRD